MFAIVGYTDTLSTPTALALDASGDKVGLVGYASKTGTIDRIEFYIPSFTGTPPTYEARLETVSSGDPSGTLIAAGATGTVTPVATGLHSVSLGTPYAITAGDVFAAVVQYSSGTIDGSNFASVNYRTTGFMASAGPVGFSNTGSWASTGYCAAFGPRYDDDSYLEGIQLITANSNSAVTFTSASAPDEYANLWTPPGGITVSGVLARLRGYQTAGSAPQILLYDSGGTVVGTIDIDATKMPTASGLLGFYYFAEGPVALTGSSDYRFGFKPDANNIQIGQATYANADALIAGNGGLYSSSRSNGGEWAQDQTLSNHIYPIISTIPAGGGDVIVPRPRHIACQPRTFQPPRKTLVISANSGPASTPVISRPRRLVVSGPTHHPGSRNTILPSAQQSVVVLNRPKRFAFSPPALVHAPRRVIVNQTATNTVVIHRPRRIVQAGPTVLSHTNKVIRGGPVVTTTPIISRPRRTM